MFSVSDRDQGAGVEDFPDRFMDLISVVSFVYDTEVRMHTLVTLHRSISD